MLAVADMDSNDASAVRKDALAVLLFRLAEG
jgi:hypothetical protein